MKKPLRLFVLSLAIITVLIVVNRWDLPVTIWFCLVSGTVALVSGIVCLASLFEL